MQYIYGIVNKTSGKRYIGKSVDPHARFQQHRSSARTGSTSVIHNAIRKYGSDGFEFDIIACAVDEDINWLEQYYIQWYNCISPRGYNLREGGQGGRHSEETKERMRHPKRITDFERESRRLRIMGIHGLGGAASRTPVVQYTLAGGLVEIHKGIVLAGAALGKGRGDAINRVLRGLNRTAYGFMWRRHDPASPAALQVDPYHPPNHYRIKKVQCRDAHGNETKFCSLTDAARKTGVSVQNISACCRGSAKSAGGSFWTFVP